MKLNKLHLFCILILGLIICSFLGNYCNINSNKKEFMSAKSEPSTYYGQAGDLVYVYPKDSQVDEKKYMDENQPFEYGPMGFHYGATFTDYSDPVNHPEDKPGQFTYYGPADDRVTVYEGFSSGIEKTTYTGPQGGSVTSYQTSNGGKAIVAKPPNNSEPTGSYIGPAGDTVYTFEEEEINVPPPPPPPPGPPPPNNSGIVTKTTYTGPRGNSATVYNSNGISKSQIPPGDEDLYILKSQVVPPVCPACPSSAACPRPEPPPPCPPCARCPEPSFECKKVPNYAANNGAGMDAILPRPVLNDFSSFGM